MWTGELGNKIMSPTNIYRKYQALDSTMGGDFRYNIGKSGEVMVLPPENVGNRF